ncbi:MULTISPECIES: tautomerase family protein [unclassified Polynucleobacter]|uniref:tautomerase family protein n=1 Tax=unclassified Polynucleobacter TaxID=2640945 RepID=UPI002572C781|nr:MULTISPECIES: 4-oxalocrotonate tautomerase [unclassified Polynucleobacter]BEI42958.1 4-oxalocrotonate tautomerase family protein [Polynucleobacter sp. HIN10]BEI44712.1 4-oxalocrotonate tautomerase family protein [Polynucleobacter sp. HIN11]
MPILNVKVSGRKNNKTTKAINGLLLDLTHHILGKKKEVTAIAIEYVEPDCWFVGGKLLSEQGKNSFYFDIKITDETNTKDEKAQYIKEAFEGFERILGNLHEESYIYVQDVRAASYGYGGKTQEYRYHR